MRRVTRSQGKASAEALMASALASTTINGYPLTYAEAMAGPVNRSGQIGQIGQIQGSTGPICAKGGFFSGHLARLSID
jgi:hypothetical protein